MQDNLWTVRGNVEDARVSVGQSAVDCRRALGKLDDQYLWTGVHLLWTGADDETLAMAPTRLLPEETRQAMATGFTSAFRDAMVARRLAARRGRRAGGRHAGMAARHARVRDAVFDSAGNAAPTRSCWKAWTMITAMTALGDRRRHADVRQATPEDRRFLVTLFEALLMLLKQDGVPVRERRQMERTQVTAPYHRLRADLHRMLNAFFLLGANRDQLVSCRSLSYTWRRRRRRRRRRCRRRRRRFRRRHHRRRSHGRRRRRGVGGSAPRAAGRLDDFDRRAKSLERTLGRLVAERDEQKLSHEELARALRGLVPETEALAQRRETQNEEGDLPPSYAPRDDEEGQRHVPSGAPPSLESAPSGGMISSLAKILVPGASGRRNRRSRRDRRSVRPVGGWSLRLLAAGGRGAARGVASHARCRTAGPFGSAGWMGAAWQRRAVLGVPRARMVGKRVFPGGLHRRRRSIWRRCTTCSTAKSGSPPPGGE